MRCAGCTLILCFRHHCWSIAELCHATALKAACLCVCADECITPDDVFDVLEEDMREADLLLWVGISFEQSASTHYFRKARECLLRAGRWRHCTQAIVNLSEDAHFNLLSACNNIGEAPGRLLM